MRNENLFIVNFASLCFLGQQFRTLCGNEMNIFVASKFPSQKQITTMANKPLLLLLTI